MLNPVTVENQQAAVAAPVAGAPVAGVDVEAANAAEATHAVTEVAGEEHHVDPTGLGLDATQWVSLAMLAVIAIMVWKKVPAMIASGLDAKIAGIREHLDAAAKLRLDAEGLKAEYQARAAQAIIDADAIRAQAKLDADALTAQAKVDAEALIVRRTRMAEDKIAAAERAAIAEVRAKVADIAVRAATQLIAENHGATNDKPLVEGTIDGIGNASLNS
ncbi:F0F1 ATP synthase subunit B [Aquisediminimonas sediminicola]|uniref:F0F1 ATP synthase subunit B family protein n=1 Tax=Alteraquisediminimonas sediminicola TaxID=2676787 RepID=UPI001C8ED2B8|nr:F0F1 ATP synthase subunit B [Aquisediminimonas sediminicola]